MKIFAPDYYEKFHCVADKCRHNCCMGWEIDIDADTLEMYKNIGGNFGKRLNESITESDGCSCFKLSCDERCPFLNEHNLCDIILELGEDALCDICTDHPRFRNFYEARTEVGLGICCEEAAKIILSDVGTVKLVEIFNDGAGEIPTDEEKEFFAWRDTVFHSIQDRTVPIRERLKTETEIEDMKSVLSFYLDLEILDDNWKMTLKKLIDNYAGTVNVDVPPEFDTCFEQLLLYFAYRHLPSVLDGKAKEKVLFFIKLGFEVIYALCRFHIAEFGSLTLESLTEYARMYSSEIEYSFENTEALIEFEQRKRS